MSELESKFNAATDFLGVVSLGGVVVSGILLFTPVRAIGYIGIGGGLGTFAASVVTCKKHLRVAEQYISQTHTDYEAKLAGKENEITSLTDTIIDLNTRVKALTQDLKQLPLLSQKVESLTNQIASKDNIVEKVTEELDRCIELYQLGLTLAQMR